VRGRAEVLPAGGQELDPRFGPELIRVVPERIVSWGVESEGASPSGRTVNPRG